MLRSAQRARLEARTAAQRGAAVEALCSRRTGGLVEGQAGSIVVHEIWPIGFFGLVAAAVALAAYRRRPD